jgi:uncharacterized protein YjbI with pentapeptide repeats
MRRPGGRNATVASAAMALPRELADLPYARALVPFRGDLAPEGDYDTLHFDGGEYVDVDAGHARFLECALSSVTFTGGRCPRARFNDVWLHGVRWVGTELVETHWLDAEMVASALSGVPMFGAHLRRVTFHNCKFDSVNARGVALRDVRFVDCLLREVDLGGAALTDVAFPGSTLDGVRIDGARMSRVDLRGATALGIRDGVAALRGATIGTAQLLDLAPLFAQALDVRVEDD